jgi:hypothetical protein
MNKFNKYRHISYIPSLCHSLAQTDEAALGNQSTDALHQSCKLMKNVASHLQYHD